MGKMQFCWSVLTRFICFCAPLTAPSPLSALLPSLAHPLAPCLCCPAALKGQAQAPAPAAAPGRPQPAQGCNPWDIPGLPSLSAAVEGHKQEADKQSRKRKATIEQVTKMHGTVCVHAIMHMVSSRWFPLAVVLLPLGFPPTGLLLQLRSCRLNPFCACRTSIPTGPGAAA